MAWRFTQVSEVARSPHDSPPKMPLPNPIDSDSRCQRIRWIGNPFGERGATSGRLRIGNWRFDFRGCFVQERQETRFDWGLRLVFGDGYRWSFGAEILYQQCSWQWFRFELVIGCQCLF